MADAAENHLSMPLNRLTLAEEDEPQTVVHLPPEIWELIFGNLRGKHLLAVRLVCHRWKAIADGKRSLWSGLQLLSFSSKSVPPIPNIVLDSFYICSVDTWWSVCGDRLTSMRLYVCCVALGTLVGMLQHCPNLKDLRLEQVYFDRSKEPEVVDFRMEKLKKLEFVGYECLFDVFVDIFSSLRILSLPRELADEHNEIGIRLIQSVQRTLECLYISPHLLETIQTTKMNEIQLKCFRMDSTSVQIERKLMEFTLHQPSLEKMLIPDVLMNNSTLIEIGRNLPGLKVLAARINKETSLAPYFLTAMSHLKELTLLGDGVYGLKSVILNLTGYKYPNLTDLVLTNFHIISINSFLSESKHLRSLTLEMCFLDELAALLDIIAEHSALRNLSLECPEFKRNVLPSRVNKLDVLKIQAYKEFTVEMLEQICKLSPRLVELHLRDMRFVDDDTVLKLCSYLPRLKRLTIVCCCITSACAEHILDRCLSLDFLHINSNHNDKYFREVFERLLKERRRYVDLNIDYLTFESVNFDQHFTE